MREEDADELLLAWDERLRRVDENLLALEAEPTYQMLAGETRANLAGRTRDEVGPALDALNELFENRERLNAVLARAKELRDEVSFWNKDEKLAEIVRLLSGPSVMLGTRHTPIAQRNLLDPAVTEVAVVPEQLLGGMALAYQVARDAVARVRDAWARLEPALETLERGVTVVRAEASDLGQAEAANAELAWLSSELGRVRALVATDPLGVLGGLETAITPRLDAQRSALADLRAHKTRALSRLGETDAVIAEIETAARDALEAGSRAAREIAGFDPEAGARDARVEQARGLAPWREKIAATAHAGRWKAADVGLERWFEVARSLLAAERAAGREARAADDARGELEGRLSARRAQAAALAARGVALPAGLETVAREAEATLRERPTDVGRAKRLVDRYEDEVRARASGTRP